MSISNIHICRACLVKCPEDRVTFESLKDVFIELTSLEVTDTMDLPRYLCNTCGELLTQFKSFKQTCIESDSHLRMAITNTTSPLQPVESIKLECQTFDDEAGDTDLEMSKPMLKRHNKPTRRTRMSQKAYSENDDGSQVQDTSSENNKKSRKRQIRKNKKEPKDEDNAERTTKPECVESSNDSDEEWNAPLKKLEKPPMASSRPEIKFQRIHSCTVSKCQRKFRTEAMLETHMKSHKGIDCTICDICGRPLTSVTNMIRHRETHKSVEERSFKCNVCNKVMVHENSLRYHMRTHDTSKSFVCDICGMGFGTSWGLKNHRKTHNTEQTFQCEQCSKSYTTYTTLYLHIKSKHEKKDEPAQCNICGLVVLSKRFLFSHCKNMHTVYTTTDNVYQCKQCDTKCKTISGLKNHERLHTGERKYKCPLCPKSYAHRSILKKHSYSHTGERPFHCEECGKGFLQKYALDVHMDVHKKQWIAQGMHGITLMSTQKQLKKKAINATETADSSSSIEPGNHFTSSFI